MHIKGEERNHMKVPKHFLTKWFYYIVIAFVLILILLYFPPSTWKGNNTVWQLSLSFLPPFLGVLGAFLIQRLWQRHQDGKDRQKFLQDVKKELESCSKMLIGEGNLCPIDMWKSGISSGLLRLIPSETRNELSSIYFRLECHNYEAEKVRDVSILAVADKGKPQASVKPQPVLKNRPAVMYTYTELLHWQLSLRLRDSEEKLRKDIDALLNKQIWN